MRKLTGGLLMAVPLVGAFAAMGIVLGWGIAVAAYGTLAGIIMFSAGWGILTEEREHEWSELNY